jgi:phosphoribosylaminoimidazolecarboxamide formyltransferase/IMP cyclohydrolase
MKIQSALISVFNKNGIDHIARILTAHQVVIYSTGGTKEFLEQAGIPCVDVEEITHFPSILGGRVKTLHPKIFGGILSKRNDAEHQDQVVKHEIPPIDLVIVDLYPFEETVANTTEKQAIIEKIDIGGPSMIRAAAKNHQDVNVIAHIQDYEYLKKLLEDQHCTTTIEQRKYMATRAFQVVAQYDMAIANWFLDTPHHGIFTEVFNGKKVSLRYGENPHQEASYYGNLDKLFSQLHGKEISYNNLNDIDGAVNLINEFQDITFVIVKHTNACGAASRESVLDAWNAALAGDPESAFGGVLCTNANIDLATAEAISEIFFEVLIAPSYDVAALDLLKQKKNRILLQSKNTVQQKISAKTVLNGVLIQAQDESNYKEWKEAGGRESTQNEKDDLIFANILCKHLKSNAIALVKNKQLIGKGCGQTSRVDATRFAIDKARQFNQDLKNSVVASDAFFPFDDCIKICHEAGIEAYIQPGGSIRDKDSIDYAVANNLVLVMTGERHFKH